MNTRNLATHRNKILNILRDSGITVLGHWNDKNEPYLHVIITNESITEKYLTKIKKNLKQPYRLMKIMGMDQDTIIVSQQWCHPLDMQNHY